MTFLKHTLISSIGVCAVLPSILCAGFESEYYTIETYSIGQPGSAMQSSNYELSQGHMMPVVAPEPEIPVDSPEEPIENIGESPTQSGTKITRIVDDQDVILETFTEPRVFDSTIPLEIQKIYGVTFPSFEDNFDDSDESSESLFPHQDQNDTESTSSGEMLTANLIMSGAGDTQGAFSNIYERLFGAMYGRALFACTVLIVLLYIRSFTKIGRKYRPF